ncbi:RNA-directed DNA polymerase from transposon X-element-like 3 [Homarus americanus]|uniref:RNA-directed DNA polymerase from transposon X-element-like 3 n=1 Tax=Homarus americanus TaxID=6706 RepID=A0A8J5JRK7_HOMAM|nr:RNA-directed DNA polymerase from transposon X-element-like 3 [Homarus americanus]
MKVPPTQDLASPTLLDTIYDLDANTNSIPLQQAVYQSSPSVCQQAPPHNRGSPSNQFVHVPSPHPSHQQSRGMKSKNGRTAKNGDQACCTSCVRPVHTPDSFLTGDTPGWTSPYWASLILTRPQGLNPSQTTSQAHNAAAPPHCGLQPVGQERLSRDGGRCGCLAVCFKEALQIQVLQADIPAWMEALFFRVVLAGGAALLLCDLYRSQWQGRAPLDFLKEHLDDHLTRHNCQHVMIKEDLSYYLVQDSYDNLLAVQGLVDHVDFSTIIHEGLRDPVISDLQDDSVRCHQLGQVGSSDQYAVLSQVMLGVARDEASTRTIWLWDHADWSSMCQAKYTAWVRYKGNPTRHKKYAHRAACRHMVATSKWAITRWEADMHRKLTGAGVGSKMWWVLVKEKQGIGQHESILPLTKPNGTLATSSRDKAELLGGLFSPKMTVQKPNRTPPLLQLECEEQLTTVAVTQERVTKSLLRKLVLFNICLVENMWCTVWKQARVVPVHKKRSKSDPGNYRPISLLSVVSKIFEKLVAEEVCRHFDHHNILLISDHLDPPKTCCCCSPELQDALENSLDTFVIAFDRIWHGGLLEKLRAKGIEGKQLLHLADYLRGRTLRVVVNSLPQGFGLGPILSAYADDCTLTCFYPLQDNQRAVQRVNSNWN